MDKKELFQKAIEERKQEKLKEAEKKTSEWYDIPYSALELNKPKAIRILGNPPSLRMGDKFSPLNRGIAMIVGDDDRKFRVVFPTAEEGGQGWILNKIINKVMGYRWDKDKDGGKGGRVYYLSLIHI